MKTGCSDDVTSSFFIAFGDILTPVLLDANDGAMFFEKLVGKNKASL